MSQLQEQFYQVMTSLKRGSRGASTQEQHDARVTELINGVLVSKPVKKITSLNESKQTSNESEPEITVLNDSWEKQHSKGASTPVAVNPVREIFEFLNGRFE